MALVQRAEPPAAPSPGSVRVAGALGVPAAHIEATVLSALPLPGRRADVQEACRVEALGVGLHRLLLLARLVKTRFDLDWFYSHQHTYG